MNKQSPWDDIVEKDKHPFRDGIAMVAMVALATFIVCLIGQFLPDYTECLACDIPTLPTILEAWGD